jgi:hypothetical protein
MEVIIALILIALAIYILVTIVIPAVVAVSGIAAVITAGIAVIVGFFSAVTNYFTAIRNNLNFLHWEWEKDDEPARRSYFFGPGYAQLFATIKSAFELNAASGAKVSETGSSFKGMSTGVWGVAKAIGGFIYTVVGYVCIYVIGTILCAILGLIHGAITTVFMILTYVIFTIVWIVDRIYLLKNKIRSDCPNCHSRFLIPVFMCPDCGAMHKKLVPGPYGIWKHKCACGKKIPATFLNGRSKLEAFCPDCNSTLVASDARPIVFQLIGGSKAGKTVYLSAFFHEYLQKLSNSKDIELTIAEQYRPYFDELEEWYNGIDCPATAQLNSQMYPLLIDSSLGVKRQFSIYDIAGEMFDGFTADSEIQQQQFHYCDGLLFLIDPFSSGELRASKINAGEDVSDFSDMAVEDVATNFINYLIRTGHAKANSRCNIPIAILIAKADIKEVKREIGPAKINSIFRNNTEQYGTYENARDSVCRQFLIDIGLAATVDNLETQFSNLHYFPVSAMGHSADGTPYEPWGIMDAIEWMLPLADKELSDLITPPTVVSK